MANRDDDTKISAAGSGLAKKRKQISSFRFGECDKLDTETLNRFISELEKESDRSVVLVAAAHFDDVLSLRVKRILRFGDKNTLDSLLSGLGALSSFSARIDFLFCMGDIGTSIHDDLHAIRKLRNHCAHKWESFTLDEEVEARFLSKMNTSLKPDVSSEDDLLNTDRLAPRSRFIVICAVLSLSLSPSDTELGTCHAV